MTGLHVLVRAWLRSFVDYFHWLFTSSSSWTAFLMAGTTDGIASIRVNMDRRSRFRLCMAWLHSMEQGTRTFLCMVANRVGYAMFLLFVSLVLLDWFTQSSATYMELGDLLSLRRITDLIAFATLHSVHMRVLLASALLSDIVAIPFMGTISGVFGNQNPRTTPNKSLHPALKSSTTMQLCPQICKISAYPS
jgi:hypothetical protein